MPNHNFIGPHLHIVSSRGAASPAERKREYEVDWSALMARAQAGDAVAYHKVLHAMTPYLRSMAKNYFAQAADIEDAVQDILMAVHAVRASYDPERPFGPWLKTVAQRRLIDCLRRAGRRTSHETELTDDHANLAMPETTELADLDLNQLFQRLPHKQAEALRLTKLNGLSASEAAKSVGLSVSALKVTAHRALQRLRRSVKQDDE